MLFLIDGYNVTMRDAELSRLSKQGQRDALLAILTATAGGRLGAGEVVVVFDAHDSIITTAERVGAVRVVYAHSADSEIVRRANAARTQVTVVTDDMRLRARISQDVARRVEYREARTCLTDKKRRRARAETVREDRPDNAREITAELADLWLADETDDD